MTYQKPGIAGINDLTGALDEKYFSRILVDGDN